MAPTHQQTFERYLYTGAIMRDADALAVLFTDDGVFEAPLLPEGHPLPRRLEGREAIRAGMIAGLRDYFAAPGPGLREP